MIGWNVTPPPDQSPGFQAGIGNVVGGSAFAAMQSLGAVTVLGTALPVIATGTVIAAAVVYKCRH